MAKKIIKKVATKVKVAKERVVTAASIVLGMFGLKVVPTDEAIIKAVQDGVECTKFDKTHLAWYKYQFKQGRWNNGEPQVLRQVAKPKTKVVAKATKKVKVVEETEEESEN